jgi:hypothetical protein
MTVDVWCEICGFKWDSLDPEVAYRYGDGRWECRNEVACFDRFRIGRAVERAIDALDVPPLTVVPDDV